MKTWPRLIEPFEEEAASSWASRVSRSFQAPWEEILSPWCRRTLDDVALDVGIPGVDMLRMADVTGIRIMDLRAMFLADQFPALRRAIGRTDGHVEEQLGWESWRPIGKSQLIKLCPRCIEESRTFYYRLPWRFKVIRTCQSHKCWLLPAHQAGNQALFRGDGTGHLAHALALDSLSLCAMRTGEVAFSSLIVPAAIWFSTLLPVLAFQMESKYCPKRHPVLNYLSAESERLHQIFPK